MVQYTVHVLLNSDCVPGQDRPSCMFLELSELVYLPGRSDVCTRERFSRSTQKLIIMEGLKNDGGESYSYGRLKQAYSGNLQKCLSGGKGTPGGEGGGGGGGVHGRAVKAWNRIMILVCFYWWHICIGAASALVQSFVLTGTHIYSRTMLQFPCSAIQHFACRCSYRDIMVLSEMSSTYCFLRTENREYLTWL